MRERPLPIQALVSLPRVDDVHERKARWRQAFTHLGQAPRVDRPPPLDGVDTGSLLQACRIAIDSGWADDLDWIGAEQSVVALYELTTALAAGNERRELGKRVVQRVYGGPAGAFVAVAQRMAWSGVRQLESATMRARVSLCLDLPVGSPVNPDPLALALISGRERLGFWVTRPATGPLPARRLAARILERAGREAVRRAQNGDTHSVEWLLGPEVRPVFERLLADREPLVWRHVAVARGLLSASSPELREEIELQLDPGLSGTEWRRSIVSLVACLSHDPDTALSQCRNLLSGELAREHPGLLATALWGLPPVIEADPDLAEQLVELIAASGRADVAEELALLREEVRVEGFADAAAESLASASSVAVQSDDPALGLLHLQRQQRLRAQRAPGSLSGLLHQALIAFETQGAHPARQLALQAIEEAHRMMMRIETAAATGALGLVRVFPELSDLGVSVLERSRLNDLLLLGYRGPEVGATVPQFDGLLDRLGNWLLRSEHDDDSEADGSPSDATLRRRKLVVFLHLLDTQSGEHQSEELKQSLRLRLRSSLLTFVEKLEADPDPIVHRVMCAALARSLDSAVREGLLEPSDLLLVLASRIDDERTLSAIIEGSTDVDMRQCLIAYDAYLAQLRGQDDPDVEPHSGSRQGLVRALTRFSSSLAARGSYRGEALRLSLQRLARALDAMTLARGLAELVADESGTRNWAEELELALDSLHALLSGATARVRGAKRSTRRTSQAPSPEQLSALLERRVSAHEPISATELENATRALVRGMPRALAEPVMRVVASLAKLPHRVTGRPPPLPVEARRNALPDWLLPRRTIGGFYVVRALGTGATSSVFVAKRIEERKRADAEIYALKVPQYDPTTARSLSEQEFLEMFRDEAGALLSLPSHPNLSRFVNFDMAAKPKPILVMELIRGQALEKLLVKRALTTRQAFHHLEGVLAGMAAMHAVGVAHLDIKPSNVILRDETTPVLVDFGLSGRQLRPGCGTLEYCAPEILGVVPKGYTPEAPRADLYAFACMAYELLTGHLLFDAEDESGLMAQHLGHDGWPAALARLGEVEPLRPFASLLGACLRRDPRDRPTIHEVRAALQRMRPRVDAANFAWPVLPTS